jgi:hypothetical protein
VSTGDTFHPRELFQALARHGVEYVTVGGVAIQAHGAQRFTRDLDVMIATSKDNMNRLAAALSAIDARILGPDGQRSRSTPSAAMLASGDQRSSSPASVVWTCSRCLCISARSRTCALARTTFRSAT